jgi:TPR repeat protein
MRARQLAAMAALAWGLLPALGQRAGAGTADIDAALLAKANAGDAAAQVAVGECYAEGKGIARDYKLAAEWYRKAADKGDVAAEMHLAALYRDGGKGFPRDMAQAAEWYRKAADKGDVAAEMHLAALYRDGGKGFPRDMAQAAEWYRKAAEQGDVGAQGTLGTLYSMGQGVQQSYVEAYYWLDLAAAVKGPKQAFYAANRQMIGIHITADELAEIQDREAAWKAAHPRPNAEQ